MNGKVRGTLRQLFLATTLVAVALGIGKWCYVKYEDRIRRVSDDLELQRYRGKRVSFCGRYPHVGNDSPFQVVWFAETPVAIADTSLGAEDWPPPQILDGATIAVTGRLTEDVPSGTTCRLPAVRRDWHSGFLIYEGRSVEQVSLVVYAVTPEEVRLVSKEESL
jgi:hypothetical protein